VDIDAVSVITVIVCAVGIYAMIKRTLSNGRKWGYIIPMATLLAHIAINVIARCAFYDTIVATQPLRVFFNSWSGAIKLHTALVGAVGGWLRWKY
jgi:hypothetical protein